MKGRLNKNLNFHKSEFQKYFLSNIRKNQINFFFDDFNFWRTLSSKMKPNYVYSQNAISSFEFGFFSNKNLLRYSILVSLPWKHDNQYYHDAQVSDYFICLNPSEMHSSSQQVLSLCVFWVTICIRVDMVGTNKVLTQWRHTPMGQFRVNIFLIRIASTYFWASEVFKNQRF